MFVFVGGEIGEPPIIAATSLQRAMEAVAQAYLKPSEPPDLPWTCSLVDGWILRCTTTRGGGDEPLYKLFIEALEVDDRRCLESTP